MATAQTARVSEHEVRLRVSDVSRQRVAYIPSVPVDATVGEAINAAVDQMRLPGNDAEGRPLVYHARLDREGRHLNAAEALVDAVKPEDELTLHPNVEAG